MHAHMQYSFVYIYLHQFQSGVDGRCMLEHKLTFTVEPAVQKDSGNSKIYIRVIQSFQVKETFYSELLLEHKYSFKFYVKKSSKALLIPSCISYFQEKIELHYIRQKAH